MDYLQYCKCQTYHMTYHYMQGFKPYYKWITFNTIELGDLIRSYDLRFKPYYKWITFNTKSKCYCNWKRFNSFKPYYKWITFNT